MYSSIEKLMSERKVTAYAVSKATGINESTFCLWKKGTSKPNIKNLMKLANYFNVSIESLLDEREE